MLFQLRVRLVFIITGHVQTVSISYLPVNNCILTFFTGDKFEAGTDASHAGQVWTEWAPSSDTHM